MDASNKRRQGAILGIVAALLCGVGAIGPWATVSTFFGNISVSGTDGDGLVVLGLAFGTGFSLLRQVISEDNGGRGKLLWAMIGFVIIGGIGIWHWNNLAELTGDAEAEGIRFGTGWGLVIMTWAGIGGALDCAVAAWPWFGGQPTYIDDNSFDYKDSKERTAKSSGVWGAPLAKPTPEEPGITKFCHVCGASLPLLARFCPHCGQEITAS